MSPSDPNERLHHVILPFRIGGDDGCAGRYCVFTDAQRVAGLPCCTRDGRHVDGPGPDQLGQTLGLGVQPEVGSHAPAQNPSHHEVQRPQVGQGIPLHLELVRFGQQLPEEGDVEVPLQPVGHRVGVGPQPDIGRAALVAGAPSDQHPERHGQGVGRPVRRGGGWSSGRRCGTLDGGNSVVRALSGTGWPSQLTIGVTSEASTVVGQ